MVTAGLDGAVKIWDTRKWGVLNEYHFKKSPGSAAFSQKGLLGLGWGNHISVRPLSSFLPSCTDESWIQVFNDLQKPGQNPRMPPAPYMTHTFPGVPVNDVLFCPFDDILGVGHARGFTSLIIPGAGEPNFDSLEADPFEGKRRRREREVNALLDKIPFDLITLDIDLVGKLDKESVRAPDEDKIGYKAVAFAKKTRMERLVDSGKAVEEEDESSGDEDEDEEARKRRKEGRIEKADAKKRARGRNSTLKKMLRKRRRNVVDPQTVSSIFDRSCGVRLMRSWGIGRDQGEDGTAAQGDSGCETECDGSSFRRVWDCWSPGSILLWQVDYANTKLPSSFLFQRIGEKKWGV